MWQCSHNDFNVAVPEIYPKFFTKITDKEDKSIWAHWKFFEFVHYSADVEKSLQESADIKAVGLLSLAVSVDDGQFQHGAWGVTSLTYYGISFTINWVTCSWMSEKTFLCGRVRECDCSSCRHSDLSCIKSDGMACYCVWRGGKLRCWGCSRYVELFSFFWGYSRMRSSVSTSSSRFSFFLLN